MALDHKIAMAIADEGGIRDLPEKITWTQIFKVIDAAFNYGSQAANRSFVLSDLEIEELLPVMQNGWDMRDYGLWVARAVERKHGIGAK